MSALVPIPYYAISPGSVRPIDPLVEVDESVSTYPAEGSIGFTTVSLQRTSALEAFLGWLDPAVTVISEEEFLGDQTPEENKQRNLEYMDDSKRRATAVALEALGYDVIHPSGARIILVDETVPAAEVLDADDVIVAVDGEEIRSWEDLVAAIGEHDPGDEVVLRIEHPSGTVGEERVTLAARPEDPELPLLGVVGEDYATFEFPFTIEIESGDVGGPSAGLAFTLAMLDLLTPEDLTGGQFVATTGTINLDGTIGQVGGIQQKTIAARRAGVDVFLVPAEEYEEASAVAGELRVEPVGDVEDALVVLERLGADHLAIASPGLESASG